MDPKQDGSASVDTEMVVSTPPTPPRPELPDMFESASDGDRSSVTDVDGTVAKFEMAYSPGEHDRFAFGVPTLTRVPGYAALAFAVLLALTVLAGYHASSNSRLFAWIVEGDRSRVFGSGPLAFIILFAAIGNVIKTALRGVVVTRDAVEARFLVASFPRVRRWTWPQIDRLIVDERDVMLELWDGSYERLPPVRDGERLVELLASIATARGRKVTRLTRTDVR